MRAGSVGSGCALSRPRSTQPSSRICWTFPRPRFFISTASETDVSAGHFLHPERPAAVNDLITAFIEAG
jgi:hypothetical protein